MRRLLLLRHAKAVPATAPLADSTRPLAPRGERDALRIAERLGRHAWQPKLILASPAARALQTAQLVADALHYRREAIALEQRLYLAPPRLIADVIGVQNPAIDVLLVVGHNPGLSELVHELLPGFDVDDLPTAAVVGLDYEDASSWDLAAATPALAYYDFPKNPSAPVTRP